MKKIFTLLLMVFTTTTFAQNVGISTTSTFNPTERLHVDGNLKIGRVAGDDANIYLANKLYDMDNSTYFIDPGASSRVNGFDMNQGSPTSNSIFFIGDDDTGIYQELASSVSIATSGSERIRVTSGGNLYVLGNDITGVKQLHFQNGELWLDGDPGSAGQVLKSDGSELYWDDISPSSILNESIFETLVSSGEILWSHSDGIDVYIEPDNHLVQVDNGSSDNWSIYITGKSSDIIDTVLTISDDVSNGGSISVSLGTPCTNSPVWINEIHYDNTGSDTGEGVEISGLSGTDLSSYSIVLYNGSNGTTYDTENLTGTLTNLSNGVGAIWFPISGIQNGAPDGIALYDGTDVIQFLSYEGSFTATNGVANGLTSINIGVSEASGSSVGHSLQLQGSGSSYSDFTWSGSSSANTNAINTSQTIVSASACSDSGGFDINAGNTATGEGFTIHVSFTGNTYIGVVTSW